MLCRHALFFSLYKTSICLKSLYKEKIAFYSICTGRIVQLTATTKGFFIIHTRHLQYKTACQRQSEETRNCMQYPHLPPGKFTTCLFLLSQALTNQSLYLQINTGVTIEAEEWLNKIFLKLHNLLGTVYNTKTHVLWWMHDMQKTMRRKVLTTHNKLCIQLLQSF